MIGIDIYSREGCGVCQRFKKRVEDMGYTYNNHDIDKLIVHHEGWREDDSINVLAALHSLNEGHLPVIKIDGKFMDFSHSINFLKDVKDGKVK